MLLLWLNSCLLKRDASKKFILEKHYFNRPLTSRKISNEGPLNRVCELPVTILLKNANLIHLTCDMNLTFWYLFWQGRWHTKARITIAVRNIIIFYVYRWFIIDKDVGLAVMIAWTPQQSQRAWVLFVTCKCVVCIKMRDRTPILRIEHTSGPSKISVACVLCTFTKIPHTQSVLIMLYYESSSNMKLLFTSICRNILSSKQHLLVVYMTLYP